MYSRARSRASPLSCCRWLRTWSTEGLTDSPPNFGGKAVQTTASILCTAAQSGNSGSRSGAGMRDCQAPIRCSHLWDVIPSRCRKACRAAAKSVGINSAHKTRTGAACGSITRVTLSSLECRVNSTGADGPSCIQPRRIGRSPGRHTNDPQPRHAIVMSFAPPRRYIRRFPVGHVHVLTADRSQNTKGL